MEDALHIQRGKSGERIAAAFLEQLGYTIKNKNVHLHHDEIDIVAYDPADEVMVFCEVKTRTRLDGDFRPELNITFDKRARMARAARHWVACHRWEGGYRMDVICIANDRVVAHYPEVRWPRRRRRGI